MKAAWHSRNNSGLGGKRIGELEREVRGLKTEPHVCCYLVIQQTYIEPLLRAGYHISYTKIEEMGS